MPKKVQLVSPLPPGMCDYWALIHVLLDEAYLVEDNDAELISAYYRTIGLRTSLDRARIILEQYVCDGAIDWADSELEEIDPASLDEDIRAKIQPISGEGFWYVSGRIFYSEEEPGNPDSKH